MCPSAIEDRRRPGRRWPLVATGSALTLLAGAGLSACGLGAGPAPSAVSLTVTRDFGAKLVKSWRAPRVRGQETVMSLLVRNARVTSAYGGGFVQSIDGLSGGHARGRPLDWFYYVNGIEAALGAAATNVHSGDHIWWDRHDWSETEHVPAVVGSFPEPFLNGIGGKRLPVRIECARVSGSACTTVRAELRRLSVPAAVAPLGGGAGPRTLRLAVAPFARLMPDPVAGAIARGPAASGVYARFSSDGRMLTALGAGGEQARVLGAGAGLVAATASGEAAPVWVVTGTDEAGVERAASALRVAVLDHRFAVAVSPQGASLPLPSPGGTP